LLDQRTGGTPLPNGVTRATVKDIPVEQLPAIYAKVKAEFPSENMDPSAEDRREYETYIHRAEGRLSRSAVSTLSSGCAAGVWRGTNGHDEREARGDENNPFKTRQGLLTNASKPAAKRWYSECSTHCARPGPPHRPHVGAADDDEGFDDDPSAPTANTLSARAVFVEPHSGHLIASGALIVRARWSKVFEQDLQVYS
jgi:hypothetical protein